MFPTPTKLVQSDYGLPIMPSVSVLVISTPEEINNILNKKISSKIIIKNGDSTITISYGLYLFDGNIDIILDLTAKTLQPNQIETFEVSWVQSKVNIPIGLTHAIIHTMVSVVNDGGYVNDINVYTYDFISDSMKNKIIVI
jgi:hypothetical protein